MNEKHLKPDKLLLKQKYTDDKTQMPVQNMSYKDKAPFIGIVGPKNSGKSKLYTLLTTTLTKKSNLEIDNIITISNSQSKITLYKSEDNLMSYIDTAKICDLVILTVDAQNIKIDTFEILSLLRAHGMPKIIVAAENLDRKNIKVVKKRIWKEVTPGIKIYNINISSDIEKMGREIKNMKYRPLQFKCNNSYLVADKVQYEENGEKYDYHFYGYIRGCPFLKNEIHIPGNGDFVIDSKEVQEDPCSVYTKKLLEKEKINFYAPKFVEYIQKDEQEEICEKIEEDSENFYLLNDAKITLKECSSEADIIDIPIEEQIQSKSNDQMPLEDLLNEIGDKFEKKAETEEDFIEKFNHKHKQNEQVTGRDARLEQEKTNNELITEFLPGQYVKITIKNINKLVFSNLVILGSINFTTKAVIQGRVKKSNHFIHSLKSNEKYLISLGWRRERIDTIFSYKDPTRNKFIKYILDEAHCNINFESNVIEPGSTFCVIKENQMIKDKTKSGYKATENIFRIAALGTVTDISGKTDIVKKLKLIGYPYKIEEHTVFVKDLFSSDLEVAKFEGAMLKTVGGIRGCVKKCIGKNGNFRATFEGRILFSDIIMLKCYIPYTYKDNSEVYSEPVQKKANNENQKNITEIIERKKEKQHETKIQKLTTKLNIDKRKIYDDVQIPNIPLNNEQKKYLNLKEKIFEKRLAIEDSENKRNQN